MGTNWPWNWRVTVLKTIKMMVIRPWHDQFQDACQSWLCCFCMWPPLSAYKSSCPLIVSGGGGSWSLDMKSASPPTAAMPTVAHLQNKANFLFHQPRLLSIGFRAASSQTLLSATLSTLNAHLVFMTLTVLASSVSHSILLGGRKVMVPVALQQLL